MNKDKIRAKLNALFDIAPQFKKILLSADDVETKRQNLRTELTLLLADTFDDNPTIPSLEWIIKRDGNRVFRTILSKRSEELAGFRFLEYLNDLMHNDDLSGLPKPSTAFFVELEHLLKAVMGATNVYSDKTPAFLKREGAKAAELRSKHLSKMAQNADRFMDRYPHGLEPSAIRRRSRNKDRIRGYFNATREDWDDWKWQVKHVIKHEDDLRSLIELSDDEYSAVKLARMNKIPFGITPYYLSLMDYKVDSGRDRALRAQVIPTPHYVRSMISHRDTCEKSMDFMLERDTSPIEGVTRRYPMIVILKPVLTCPQICVYCQRNWQIEDVHSEKAAVSKDKLDNAVSWIEERPEIKEVLVTGGDPFMLSDTRIDYILSRLSGIDHIERIRIGTRTPVTLPQRITDDLVKIVASRNHPGKQEIVIVTHFEHQYELTPQAQESVQKFRRQGLQVYNQLVYTFYNSRKFEAAAMRHRLHLSGITPYYTFNTKGKEETDDYRVPIARLLQEQKEEARLLPGTVRTDEIVFNVPKLGKNYLRAEQHHDVISILPDGKRVYEFHPWEKNLSLVDTYIYKDVGVYDYVRRLKEAGENPADYKTIYYYY